ncbi:hypothetical protein GCM10007242_40740 [Pigmentiphaga litoralis]|nr:hypothetical protein GCM10007242_40740 [Pigmentiphaga litoralis]
MKQKYSGSATSLAPRPTAWAMSSAAVSRFSWTSGVDTICSAATRVSEETSAGSGMAGGDPAVENGIVTQNGGGNRWRRDHGAGTGSSTTGPGRGVALEMRAMTGSAQLPEIPY